jgi:hypothetical protein
VASGTASASSNDDGSVLQSTPPDIEAELDNDGDIPPLEASGSVMGVYLHAVYARLQLEVGGVPANDTSWLLNLLEENDFWVRAVHAKTICKQLKVIFQEPSYYRDVKVWLPEQQWGPESKPCCIFCKSAQHVHPKDWPYPGRRICHLTEHYYVMTRRYYCTACDESQQRRPKKSWYAYDPECLPLYPHGHGDEFPAFLTHRSGVDNLIIDMMRPLYDKGIRPHNMSDLLLEMHSKKYHQRYIRRERLLAKGVAPGSLDTFLGLGADTSMYSTFADKTKYAGLVPTGEYLSRCHLSRPIYFYLLLYSSNIPLTFENLCQCVQEIRTKY